MLLNIIQRILGFIIGLIIGVLYVFIMMRMLNWLDKNWPRIKNLWTNRKRVRLVVVK